METVVPHVRAALVPSKYQSPSLEDERRVPNLVRTLSLWRLAFAMLVPPADLLVLRKMSENGERMLL